LTPGFADLLLHVQLDGQAVAVPARHVGRVEAVQGLVLDDDVLEHLVDRVPHVQIAVGVGRAVVEDEGRSPGARLADALVELHGLPLLQALGLPLGQVGLHGESRLGRFRVSL
jgi:hypothetical protein